MTATTAERQGSRTWLIVAVIVIAVLGVVLLTPRGSDRPYDLDNPGPAGYKGMRLVLERLGASVDRIDATDVSAGSASRYDVVFVPVVAGVSRSLSTAFDDYVRAGGQLVQGTPRNSGSFGERSTFGGVDIVAAPPGDCTMSELRDARDIDPAGAVRIDVPSEADHCYGDSFGALVMSRAIGAGRLVTLASPDLFVNDAMRAKDQEVDDPKGPMEDNVVVAQRLLAPGGRGAKLAVVTSGLDASVTGDTSLVGLIRPGVKLGMWELVCAFVLYAWFRGRRLGRVVHEPQPVPIAGSELVSAVGNLMERREDPGRAAAMLRSDACRQLSERLGVPRGTDPATLAAMIASRTRRDPAQVFAALAGQPVSDDATLLTVAARLESIRQEILHGR